jgi:hypothetical protein
MFDSDFIAEKNQLQVINDINKVRNQFKKKDIT